MKTRPRAEEAPGFNRRERHYLGEIQRRLDRLSEIITYRNGKGLVSNGELSERAALEWALVEVQKSRAALSAARQAPRG